jgi:hypothetical protein
MDHFLILLNNIYFLFGWYAILFFVGYVVLDSIFFKIRRIMRNFFTALIISLSMVLMNRSFGLGLFLFILMVVFGDRFYYRYMIFKNPPKKEKPDGPVL